MKLIHARTTRVISLVAIITLFLSACQTAAVYTSDTLKRDDQTVRVLVMPMDVELSELGLGGTTVRADWTEAATGHLESSLAAYLSERNVDVIPFIPATNSDTASNDVQLIKLFGVVGETITLHHYFPSFALPNKKEKFDWSMGPETTKLSARYDAEYALFISVRDSYASAERAAAIAVAAIFGIGIQGGIQTGSAALVDLRTGEFAWFNRLARGTGDIRTEEPAKETLTVLMEEFPK